jgi:hypothetical protein
MPANYNRPTVRLGLLFIAACATHAAVPPKAPAPPAEPVVHHLDDPDLNPPPPRKLLAIDWAAHKLDTDADALALWKLIAPTGEDWEQKLDEIPAEVARPLATALLREGNFACKPAPPPVPCSKAPPDLGDPAPDATLADPCLRRMLALWSLAQLEPEDLPKVLDALRAIAALPPPESQLVSRAINAVAEPEQDLRLELLGIAQAAGQYELVAGALSSLDEDHLERAVTDHHIGAALDVLPAERHRATFVRAITDDKIQTAPRDQAIIELAALADKLPTDVHTALITAAKSHDCTVAATAARTLDLHGDRKYVPKLPTTRSPDAMMRALCVLASYEQQSRPDEPSYLPGYIPTAGTEIVIQTYDEYADPHVSKNTVIEKPAEISLPELDDMVRAFRHCTGTSCKSDDREFRFSFAPFGGQLLLSRLEVIDRPPCSP